MRVVCFVAVTSLTGCQALVSGDDILTDSCRNDENVDPYVWRNGTCFEISQVDGLPPITSPGADIMLTVVGRAVVGTMEPSSANGFAVQAVIRHDDFQGSFGGANGYWRDAVGGWVVSLTAPEEPRDGYYVQVGLYCPSGACTEVYGDPAQTAENYYFDVSE